MSDFSSSDGSEFSQMSETDSDLEIMLEERIRPKNQSFFEQIVPQFNDKEHIEHFRVSKDVAADIAVRFENSEYYKWQLGPHEKLTSLKQTQIFLWFAGHQSASFCDVADIFNICISSLHKVTKRMTYFLSNLAPEVIIWPNNERQAEIERHFREKNGYPGIIGAVDGTHIKIDKPLEDPDSYINRKGYYSIQAQLVCDHQLKITNLFVGYPGSVHDARVFRTSDLFHSLQEKCNEFHILGDSAYPLMYNLMTPFPDRGMLTRNQINYNFQHSSNRICIEHCNGLLKQKWRQLYHLKLRDIRTIVHFIRACCVLHNLALNDNFLYIEGDNNLEANENNVNLYDIQDAAEHANIANPDAVQKRNMIVNTLQ